MNNKIETDNEADIKDNGIYNLFKFLGILLLIFYFYIQSKFMPYISEQVVNYVLQADSILNGDIFLSHWNLSYLAHFFTELPYYIFTVMFLGVSSKSLSYGIFFSSAVYALSSILLIKDNPKHLKYTHFLLYIMLWGVSSGLLSGASGSIGNMSLIFILIYLVNKYINTNDKKILIAVSFIFALSLLSDLLVINLFVLPLFLYALIRCFYSNSKMKNQNSILMFLALVLLILSLVYFYTLYIKFKVLSDYNSFSNYIIEDNIPNFEGISSKLAGIVEILSNTFEFNALSLYFFSFETVVCLIRLVIFLTGLKIITENIILFFQNKTTDFVSICLSIGIIIQLFLAVYTNYYDIFEQNIIYITSAFAILILRKAQCFSSLNIKQTIILLCGLGIFFVYSKIPTFLANCTPYFYFNVYSALKLNNVHQGLAISSTNEFGIINVKSSNKIQVIPVTSDVVDNKCKLYPINQRKNDWYQDKEYEFILFHKTEDKNDIFCINHFEALSKTKLDLNDYYLLIFKDKIKSEDLFPDIEL